MDRDAQRKAEQILRDAGVSAEAISAKRNMDTRLDGLGLSPSLSAPRILSPGRAIDVGMGEPKVSVRMSVEQRVDRIARQSLRENNNEGHAVSALLLRADPNIPKVVADTPDGDAIWQPSDLSGPTAVTALGTTAAGGTEVKFNHRGIVHVGSGAVGCYWSRAIGAGGNTWYPLLAGQHLAYDPANGLFFGQSTAGGITPGGALTLGFYKMPEHYPRNHRGWKKWHEQVTEWTDGAGSDNGAGVIANLLLSGTGNGTDVTLGTFSDAGGGTQIFKVATNFPIGGAVTQGAVIMNALATNTDVIWVAETGALAVASNGMIAAAGQDINNRPKTGTLFMLAKSGTQVLGARYRS